MNDYISKPVALDELRQTIEKHLTEQLKETSDFNAAKLLLSLTNNELLNIRDFVQYELQKMIGTDHKTQ